MGESIESFVAKLQAEGVEAGKQAAEKLRAEAKQQAETIVAEARAQAEKIIADANKQAEEILTRSTDELALAARDVVLRLREALQRALEAVLRTAAREHLVNSEFLAKTLHDLVLMYAKADIDRNDNMRINVSPELQGELANWAINEIGRKAQEAGMHIDLKGELQTAGFEYSIAGATVEVTPESVAGAISELVAPRLRELIDAAVRDEAAKASQATE